MILIGADPELFVFTRDGKPVSAHDLIPGTKYDPFEVSKGAVQVDGVAAEFNIEPANTEDEFFFNIASVEAQLLEMIQKKNSDFILRATPTVNFTRKQWKDIPEEAKLLGCEPDYDAYSCKPNEKPKTDKFMRTGSGHVHISWGQTKKDVLKPWDQHCASLVWHLDKHLYPESLKWDPDKTRQELYGKPGCFRPKKYGLEYRTLSNAWLANEKTIRYVFKTTKNITEHWLDNYRPGDYKVEPYDA